MTPVRTAIVECHLFICIRASGSICGQLTRVGSESMHKRHVLQVVLGRYKKSHAVFMRRHFFTSYPYLLVYECGYTSTEFHKRI